MSSSESSTTFHRPSLADKIRRNDTGWPSVTISEDGGDVVEILDAQKYNTVVKQVYISCTDYLLQEVNQEAYVKVSEVMKCNCSSSRSLLLSVCQYIFVPFSRRWRFQVAIRN